MRIFLTVITLATLGLSMFGGIAPASAQENATDLPSQFVEPENNYEDSFSQSNSIDWRALMSHPCFQAVGMEIEDCKEKFDLTADLELLWERGELVPLLHRAIDEMLCPRYSGVDFTLCTQRVLFPEDFEFLRKTVDEEVLLELRFSSDTYADDLNQHDLPFTTRQHARVLLQNRTEEGNNLSTQERSALLWNMCADSSMRRTTCFSNHFRFITDATITLENIEDVIR